MARSDRSSAIQEELRRVRAALDASAEAVFFVDPASMTIVDANKTACQTLGCSHNDLLGAPLAHVSPELSPENSADWLDELIRGLTDAATFGVLRRRTDGRELPVQWRAHGAESTSGPLVIVFAQLIPAGEHAPRDWQIDPLLLTDLGHDVLTRLPNRRLFEQRLGRAIKLAHRCRDYAYAVLFVDLDGFKAVNDRLGHAQGDRLLCEVARRLSRCVRPGDLVARIGGDEFTVLVENLRKETDAVHVAERIQAGMTSPICLDGEEVRIAASIGIALGSQGYTNPEAVLRDADRAMYRAKSIGKSPHVFRESDFPG